jgi:Uma2 family endonuclease
MIKKLEFFSPTETKITGNILHCLKHGTSLGWLIDPDVRSPLKIN